MEGSCNTQSIYGIKYMILFLKKEFNSAVGHSTSGRKVKKGDFLDGHQ